MIDDPKEKPLFEDGKKYVITDCHICKPDVFNQVSRLYPDAYYILFSNNPSQCLINIKNRDDGRIIPDKYVQKLSTVYDINSYANKAKYKSLIEVYHGD